MDLPRSHNKGPPCPGWAFVVPAETRFAVEGGLDGGDEVICRSTKVWYNTWHSARHSRRSEGLYRCAEDILRLSASLCSSAGGQNWEE
jgi:hypothetical protein